MGAPHLALQKFFDICNHFIYQNLARILISPRDMRGEEQPRMQASIQKYMSLFHRLYL